MRKHFYGWTMVGVLFFLEFVNMGFPFYGGGVINTYMLKRVAMDRSMYGLGFTLLNFFVGVPSALVAGSILRLGLRATFVIGSSLICIGALWMNFFVIHPWQYLLGFGVLVGTGIGFGTIVPISTGVTRWFVQYRGKAMAITFSASGCAGFLCVPFFSKVLSANGGNFHQAWLIVAGSSAVGAIFAWIFVKESPASLGQTPDGLPLESSAGRSVRSPLITEIEWTAATAYRTRTFWMIMLGAIACQFPFFFFNAHALLHMKDNAVPAQTAAWAVGTFTAVGIVGRLIGGWFIDKVDARAVFILGIFGYLVGSVLAIRIDGNHIPLAFAAASCYGWGFGCSWISLHTITGNFYGVAVYPRLNGTIMVISSLVCAPAGIIGGRIFDMYRSYAPAFYLNAAIALLGMIALMFARMPKASQRRALRCLVPAIVLFSLPVLAQTPHDARGDKAGAAAAKPGAMPEELLQDKSVEQAITVHGETLHYTATVGTIRLTDEKGKPTGDVMYTAYTLNHEKGAPDRPVLFAVNGGPGASSVYLNLGAIGPKHIEFAVAGESASDPATLTDNPGTWLDFTDEVFIDPIGTGFSKSLVDEAETKKLFYTPTPDIQYLSLVIYKWLVKNDRLLDKKYLIGESYGGYRVPRMAHYMQSQLGVAINGLVLVSPYLNPSIRDGSLSPIPWMIALPSITAAHLENEHKLTASAMQDVIAYTEGEYATALIRGPKDRAATDAMVSKVTEMTGLDPEFVKYSGGRLETGAYLREVHREKGEIGSAYDSNVTAPDPFPYSQEQQSGDPILESSAAPTTQAIVNFITNTVGWKSEERYYTNAYDVNRQWDRNEDLRKGAVIDLREAIAADPKLQVLIVHGWNDLACPFMGSLLTQNQLPTKLARQVQVHEFPGGHMFYTRPGNQRGFHELAAAMVRSH